MIKTTAVSIVYQDENETLEEQTTEPITEECEESAEEQQPEETHEPTELDKAKAEAEDFKRKWYNTTAEYDNYRKRTASTRSQAYAEGRADVVKGLFPIADNLELALQSCTDEKTRKGIEMITRAFEKLLEEEKITEIYPLGEQFSAETSEAVFAVDPEEGEESGVVKQVFRKGYEQNGKILRFAQVSVTK